MAIRARAAPPASRESSNDHHTHPGYNSLLARETTPSTIVRYLDEYVIGQDEAKKVLAVAVYSHYRKIATLRSDQGAIAKSNVLLVGPSGTGKTLLCDTLSRMLKVPFVTADATSLAQTKYANEEIEAALQRLLDKADGNIEHAQQGIVFIDEIDKLRSSKAAAEANKLAEEVTRLSSRACFDVKAIRHGRPTRRLGAMSGDASAPNVRTLVTALTRAYHAWSGCTSLRQRALTKGRLRLFRPGATRPG